MLIRIVEALIYSSNEGWILLNLCLCGILIYEGKNFRSGLHERSATIVLLHMVFRMSWLDYVSASKAAG